MATVTFSSVGQWAETSGIFPLVASLNWKEVEGHAIETDRFKNREDLKREIMQRAAQWRQARQERYRGRTLYVRGFDEYFTEEEALESGGQ